MYKPESIYTRISLSAIVSHIKKENLNEIPVQELPDKLKVRQACFVTLHTKKGDLRGCIGTIIPYRENLYQEIIQNSISVATNDTRFDVVAENELDDICISISVLSEPFKINSFSELNPKTKGLIIKLEGRTQSVFLPNIKGIDTIDDQIYKLKKKAGIEDIDNEDLEFYAFTVKEYK